MQDHKARLHVPVRHLRYGSRAALRTRSPANTVRAIKLHETLTRTSHNLNGTNKGRRMFGLLPKNLEFFDCFERAAQNSVHCAELLADLAKSGEIANVERIAAIIESEHAGDRITHETLDRLEQTYITPIDRDDIHRLITRIDDVVDATEAVAQRMMYYKITSIKEGFQNQCGVLVKAAKSMGEAVTALRYMKDRGKKAGVSIEKLMPLKKKETAFTTNFWGSCLKAGSTLFKSSNGKRCTSWLSKRSTTATTWPAWFMGSC